MIIKNNITHEDVLSVSAGYEPPTFRQPTKDMVEKGMVFSFYEKGEYLGYIIFLKEYGDGVWSIPALATKKGYEGRGIMKALFIEAFMSLEPQRIWLEVHPDNTAARGLYKYFGFTETENVNVKYDDGKNMIMCEYSNET